MAQVTNYAVSNGPRASVRQGFNDVLEALRDDNAGATAPSNPVPGMRWRDTSVSPAVLRIRNDANSAWVTSLEALGASAIGLTLFSAANGAVARGAMAAAPIPAGSAITGQWTRLAIGPSSTLLAPSGGTWAYFALETTELGSLINTDAGIAAGGGVIYTTNVNRFVNALCWRVL